MVARAPLARTRWESILGTSVFFHPSPSDGPSIDCEGSRGPIQPRCSAEYTHPRPYSTLFWCCTLSGAAASVYRLLLLQPRLHRFTVCSETLCSARASQYCLLFLLVTILTLKQMKAGFYHPLCSYHARKLWSCHPLVQLSRTVFLRKGIQSGSVYPRKYDNILAIQDRSWIPVICICGW